MNHRVFRSATIGEIMHLANRYAHRNGETEAPTELGEYWFKGNFGSDEMADMTTVSRVRNGGLLAFCPESKGSDDGFYFPIGNFVGQWWGPIVPPWEATE